MADERTVPVPPPAPGSDATARADAEATLPTAEALATPGGAPRRLGKFELLEELGSGGMGTVYKAFQADLQRLVALKTMHGAAAAGSAMVERFQREARAAARLDHPGIVRVFEVGVEGGVHYIAMELVAGENLLSRVRRASPPLPDRIRWLRDAALAVHYAHGQGLVHRDLKPHNLLVDAQGTVKVADFGLARDVTAERGLTVSGETMGTPQYMAPEQARGKWDEVGPRSDVYSLGATLYEVIAGAPPVDGKDVYSILEKVVKGDLVPIRRRVPKVPRDLETICQKAIDAEPEKRYTSAKELAEDLDRFLRFEPILARPLSWRERLVRGAKRHRARLAMGTVATAALAFAIATMALGRGTQEAMERARRSDELARLALDPAHVLTGGGAEEMERLLREAIELNPANAQAHLRLGMLVELRSLPAALDAFPCYEAATRDPRFAARARFRRILLLAISGGIRDLARGQGIDLERELMDLETTHAGTAYARIARPIVAAVDWPDDTTRQTVEETLRMVEAARSEAPEARLLAAGLRSDLYHPLNGNHFPPARPFRDTDLALQELGALLDADPFDLVARMNRAMLQYDAGHLQPAEADLRWVIAFAPRWGEPYFCLGRVLFSQRRYDDAERAFERSLENEWMGRTNDHRVLNLFAMRRFAEALAASEEGVRRDAENRSAHILRILSLRAMGRLQDAEAAVAGLPQEIVAYFEPIRKTGKELSKPQFRFVVETIRRDLREFQAILFATPRQKAAIRSGLGPILAIPQVRGLVERYAGHGQIHSESDELFRNLPWIEREHPELWASFVWLIERMGVRADPAMMSLIVEFGFKLTRDGDIAKRRSLLTMEEHLWKAGIHYREGRYAEAEAILEHARQLDVTNDRVHWGLATMRALRGDAKGCADALWLARQFGWGHVEWVLDDPDFAKVKDDPAVKSAVEAK